MEEASRVCAQWLSRRLEAVGEVVEEALPVSTLTEARGALQAPAGCASGSAGGGAQRPCSHVVLKSKLKGAAGLPSMELATLALERILTSL